MVTKYDLMKSYDDIRHFSREVNQRFQVFYDRPENPAVASSYIRRIYKKISIECAGKVTLNTVKKYHEYIVRNWEYFLKTFRNLPGEIFDHYIKEIKSWKPIFMFQSLDESFLRSHEKTWNKLPYAWDYISYFQLYHLPVSFIYDYEDKINFYLYAHNRNGWALPFDLLKRHKDEMELSGMDFSNEEFILEEYLDTANSSNQSSEYFIYNWIDNYDRKREVSSRKHLSEEFIEKHIMYLDMRVLFSNHETQLSEKFIENHSDIVPWLYISKNYTLSKEFLERNKGYIFREEYIHAHPELVKEVEDHVWDIVSQYYPFDNRELFKYQDKINWDLYLKGDSFKNKDFYEQRMILLLFDKHID